MSRLLLLCACCFLFNSCQKGNTYERILAKELAKEERHDDLFLDVHLGMTSDAFYKHCWELNKQQIVKEGQANSSVVYPLNDNELNFPAIMNFYPKFFEGKVYEMPVSFSYKSWAPWNKDQTADALLSDVKDYLEQHFGGEFFVGQIPELKGPRWIKLDGNRRIILNKTLDGSAVIATITDMIAWQKKQEQDAKLPQEEGVKPDYMK